jgi:hypothetical protein
VEHQNSGNELERLGQMNRVEVGDTEVGSWRTEEQRFGVLEHWRRDEDKEEI